MKKEDIKEFELGEHCFGDIISVNGLECEDLDKEDMIEFVVSMFDEANNINSNLLLREVFKTCLEYLECDCVEEDSSSCEQCGNFNSYSRYVINEGVEGR